MGSSYGLKAFDRIVEFYDGWLPTGIGPSVLADKISLLRQCTKAAGRDPGKISVTSIYFYDSNPDQREIEELEKAGVERVVFGLPSAKKDVLLSLLDTHASRIR